MKKTPFALAFIASVSIMLGAPERLPDYVKLRTAVTGLLNWKVAVPSDAFEKLTFFEAAEKATTLGLGFVEGFDTQRVGPDLAKNLDCDLGAGERASVKNRLLELKVKMAAYHVTGKNRNEEEWRKLFDFAKAVGVETIISPREGADLPLIGRLADEFGINVALRYAGTDFVKELENVSDRIGVQADIGQWMRQGVKPVDGLKTISSRLMGVNLRDASALGERGHPVILGSGAANLEAFLLEMSRLERPESLVSRSQCGNCSRALVWPKSIMLMVEPTGLGDPITDLSQSLQGFEKAVRPAMGDFVDAISKATPITSPLTVPVEDRQKIEAALPREAPAQPKKLRKLLILDLCPAGGYYHTTIADANLALELMAKNTKAYEPIFSNDLDNLKYPKIKQFDAVFLNSTVGEDFIDPEVLDGLIRFVREGGGLAGIHGATYASMDLPAFGDMIGAQDGPHRVETATLKIDDPSSPLTAAFADSPLTKEFGGREFVYTDEFYHFLPTGPFSREKLHVLLSIDTQKSDMSTWHVRPDNDYGLSWIRNYGKGRVFNCALGHTPTLFETPALATYILSGIQFVLGDLAADATPSAQADSKRLTR